MGVAEEKAGEKGVGVKTEVPILMNPKRRLVKKMMYDYLKKSIASLFHSPSKSPPFAECWGTSCFKKAGEKGVGAKTEVSILMNPTRRLVKKMMYDYLKKSIASLFHSPSEFPPSTEYWGTSCFKEAGEKGVGAKTEVPILMNPKRRLVKKMMYDYLKKSIASLFASSSESPPSTEYWTEMRTIFSSPE